MKSKRFIFLFTVFFGISAFILISKFDFESKNGSYFQKELSGFMSQTGGNEAQEWLRARYIDVTTGQTVTTERLAEIEVRDNGKLMAEMRGQVNYHPEWFRYYGGLADKIEGAVMPIDKPDMFAFTRYEAVGVVGVLTAWNSPLLFIAWKCAPAIAAGCTVVLKPSEIAPVNAIILAEIIHDAGLPAGVFNLVNGLGPVVGEVLASHPEVDMVSFTGSTRAGKRVAELAADSVKRVALELGGKSASIILPDADFEAAVRGSINACLLNSGQTCSAHTRMLVPEDRYDEVKSLAQAAIAKFTLGASLDEGSRLGPLVSAAQRDRVMGFIQQGLAEGAELVAGGPNKPPFAKGYFVQPTVLRVQPTDTLAREEIFGPVLVILTYEDEAEAIRIANDSIYGLGGGVWSTDEAHALRVARQMRTGQVDINGAPFNGNAPFGGYKQSGNGRENGRYGFEEFLEHKAIQLKPAEKN
jgi:betaine-aldehyde dehydrogenase